jgi:hypothetical protein
MAMPRLKCGKRRSAHGCGRFQFRMVFEVMPNLDGGATALSPGIFFTLPARFKFYRVIARCPRFRFTWVRVKAVLDAGKAHRWAK